MAYKRKEVIGEMKKTLLHDVEFKGFPSFCFIYAISKNDTYVYIGSTNQTIKSRIRAHISDAISGSVLPIHNWMRCNDYKFDVVFLEQVQEIERVEKEKKWIKTFKNLLNLTDGGGGMSGHKFAGTDHARSIGNKIKTGANFNCKTCGKSFWRKRCEILKGNNKFCSKGCFAIWQKNKKKN